VHIVLVLVRTLQDESQDATCSNDRKRRHRVWHLEQALAATLHSQASSCCTLHAHPAAGAVAASAVAVVTRHSSPVLSLCVLLLLCVVRTLFICRPVQAALMARPTVSLQDIAASHLIKMLLLSQAITMLLL
jgi:hypothetical protein